MARVEVILEWVKEGMRNSRKPRVAEVGGKAFYALNIYKNYECGV